MTIQVRPIDGQVKELKGDAEKIIGFMDTLPIPGFSDVLKPLKYIFDMYKPDQYSEIERELKKANERLENMYSVILTALRVHDLELEQDKIKAKINTLIRTLAQDSRLGGSLPPQWNHIRSIQTGLSESLDISLLTCGRLLKGYETVTKNDSGSLVSYIGGFVAGIELALENVALVYYGYNMIVNQNVNLEELESLEQADMLIGDECVVLGEEGVAKTKIFIKEDLPKYYPEWCRGVFSNSFVTLNNVNRLFATTPFKTKKHIEIIGAMTDRDVNSIKITLAAEKNDAAKKYWNITQDGKKWFCLGGSKIPKSVSAEDGKGAKVSVSLIYTEITENWEMFYNYDILYEHQVIVIKTVYGSTSNMMIASEEKGSTIVSKIYKSGDEKAQWKIKTR